MTVLQVVDSLRQVGLAPGVCDPARTTWFTIVQEEPTTFDDRTGR